MFFRIKLYTYYFFKVVIIHFEEFKCLLFLEGGECKMWVAPVQPNFQDMDMVMCKFVICEPHTLGKSVETCDYLSQFFALRSPIVSTFRIERMNVLMVLHVIKSRFLIIRLFKIVISSGLVLLATSQP